MPWIAQLVRRPSAVIWVAMLFASALALATIGLRPLTIVALIGAAVVAILLALGDIAAIEIEDGRALAPAPAVLIAGLSLADWPLLMLAALIGTLVATLRRRGLAVALRAAGARALAAALAAPIYFFVEPPAVLPYSTLAGLLGLLPIGALVVAIELLGASDWEAPGELMRRWRAWRGTLRWYAPTLIAMGGLLGVLWLVSPWVFLLGLATLVVAQHAFRVQLALRRTTIDLERLAGQRESLTVRLERLQALATTMIGTLDIQEMLDLLCERLAALLDAPYGWVVLRDDTGRLRPAVCHNLPFPADERQSLADQEGYMALIERGRVVLITDERRHALTPAAEFTRSAPWMGVLTIPLVGEKRALGAICLAFEQVRGLDADNQRVLASFARQAAWALENARLFEELRHKQAELIQSSKLAAVGTFAAGIAHEFNNLLGGMLGFAELGFRSDDVSDKDHSLEVVMQSCRRGRSITRGLLTFARRQEHHRALADVGEAISETLALIEIDLRKSMIDVVKEIDMVSLTVCDLGQISQVVLNLLTNARDAMKPDGGTITVGLHERNGAIELSVADTGSGIPEEIRDKIFEPFVTTKGALGGSQTPGTGLGLSISYGIVQEHGGAIIVDSVVGRGTTMIVRLPIVAETLEREAMAGAR